jgi:uncharacterized protein YegP (UPF0339 family)
MPNEGYQFLIYPDKIGEWRWQFRSIGNSELIADSGDGYKNKADCEYSIALVKAYAPSAPVVPATLKK